MHSGQTILDIKRYSKSDKSPILGMERKFPGRYCHPPYQHSDPAVLEMSSGNGIDFDDSHVIAWLEVLASPAWIWEENTAMCRLRAKTCILLQTTIFLAPPGAISFYKLTVGKGGKIGSMSSLDVIIRRGLDGTIRYSAVEKGDIELHLHTRFLHLLIVKSCI